MFERIGGVYRGSIAVVIGAGGIGHEIAAQLCDAGATVVVADRRLEQLERVASLADRFPCIVRPLDVCSGGEVEDFFQDTCAAVGTPHFLFYTAGILTIEPFHETTESQWMRAIDVNLNGVFRCISSVGRRMSSARRGSILVLGSIAGTKARSGSRVNPVYNTSKAGVASLVNAAAMQLRPFGVRVNCISPGPTETPMMDVQPPAVHELVKQITLDGRMNEPSEVAELALFVAGHGRFTGEDVGMGGGAGLGG